MCRILEANILVWAPAVGGCVVQRACRMAQFRQYIMLFTSCQVHDMISFPLPAVLLSGSSPPSCWCSYPVLLGVRVFCSCWYDLLATLVLPVLFRDCGLVEFRFVVVFLSLFSGVACGVVFSYPVHRHSTWLTHEFAMIFVFGLPLCLTARDRRTAAVLYY